MCLLTTQYLSSLLLISSETKGWRRNARQSFLTFLGGLRKSSAVLNLILSVQLTARGGSVRGFISAVYLSVEKLKVRESPAVKKKRKFFFFPVQEKNQKHQFLFDFILWCLDYDNKRHRAHLLHTACGQSKHMHTHKFSCFFILSLLCHSSFLAKHLK